MLCKTCHRRVAHGAGYCRCCGQPLTDAPAPLELVLPDGSHVPATRTLTIGRAAGNGIRLADPSVSRQHARLSVASDGAYIEDVGSSHGTFVNGRKIDGRTRVESGFRVQFGDAEVRIDTGTRSPDPHRTIVVPPGASLVLPSVGPPELEETATEHGFRPRCRSGWALKQLEEETEEEPQFVLKDLNSGKFLRLGPEEAALYQLLDGKHTLPELVRAAEEQFGSQGASRLATLIADLGERGMLAGVEGHEQEEAKRGRLARLLRPREVPFPGANQISVRLYEAGGWILYMRGSLLLMALIAVAGIGVFVYLIASGLAVPFVVGGRVGIGALIFVLGRLAIVSVHELAHGFTVTSYGRQISKAGLKFVFVFPYAYVDTSDAWFETRRRRIAISASGPASDLIVGGAMAIGAAAVSAGTARETLFQLALAAYMGAFFNLNPLLDRDGYQMLVDYVRIPNLRHRSRQRLSRFLAGRAPTEDEPRALLIYGTATIAWSILALGFVIILTRQYFDKLAETFPTVAIWIVFGLFYLLMFLPVVAVLTRPLIQRLRDRREEPQLGT